jgi:hypothetical protein
MTNPEERIAADAAEIKRQLAKQRRLAYEAAHGGDGRPRTSDADNYDPLLEALIREHGNSPTISNGD